MLQRKPIRSWAIMIALLLALACLSGCQAPVYEQPSAPAPQQISQTEAGQPSSETPAVTVQAGQRYSTPEAVAAYLHQYHELPPNYLTKAEAQQLGWNNAEGNLWEVTEQMSIGGDRFGNREGLLPKASGRQYYECDINYQGGYRGAERIVYSNDGLIFYSADHYQTFKQLY